MNETTRVNVLEMSASDTSLVTTWDNYEMFWMGSLAGLGESGVLKREQAKIRYNLIVRYDIHTNFSLSADTDSGRFSSIAERRIDICSGEGAAISPRSSSL